MQQQFHILHLPSVPKLLDSKLKHFLMHYHLMLDSMAVKLVFMPKVAYKRFFITRTNATNTTPLPLFNFSFWDSLQIPVATMRHRSLCFPHRFQSNLFGDSLQKQITCQSHPNSGQQWLPHNEFLYIPFHTNILFNSPVNRVYTAAFSF